MKTLQLNQSNVQPFERLNNVFHIVKEQSWNEFEKSSHIEIIYNLIFKDIQEYLSKKI